MVVSLRTFQDIVKQNRKHPWIPNRRVISLDPGETTGIAIFEDDKLIDSCQLNTKDVDLGVQVINRYIEDHKPAFVVYESYRVYAWKASDHAWNKMHTSQLIGGIEVLCGTLFRQKAIPTIEQTAQVAKQFVTDEKLKVWGMYAKGQRHARDAVRHGCWFILFGEEKWLKENAK